MGLFDFFKKPKDTAPTSEAPKAPDTLAPPPPRSDLIQATQAPERALHERAVTRAELSNSNRINLSRSQTVDNSPLTPAPQNSLPHARKLVLGDSLPPLHAHAEEPLEDTCAATTEDNIQILPPPQASKAELAANARAAQVSALKNPPSSPKQAPIVLSKNANAHLPALEFLNVLPANCVASGAIAHARSSNAEIAISREEAIGLLSLGSFRFYACGVCDKLPQEYLTPMAARDESVLEIPLIKILPVIPLEWLKISGQDESRLETLEAINDPFRDIFVKQAPRSPTAPPVSPIPQQAPPKPSPASQRRDVLRLPVQSLASRLPAEAVAKASQGEVEFDRNTVLELLALGSFTPSYALIAKLAPGLLQTNAASLDESCSIPLSEILPLLPPTWLDAAPDQDRSRLATLIEMNDPFSGAFTDAKPKANAKAQPESAPAAKAPEPSTPAKAPPSAPATPPKVAKIQDSGMDLILGDAFLDSAIKLKEPTAFDLSVEDTMIGRVPPAPQLPGKAKTLPLRNTSASPLPPPPEAPPASGIKPKSLPLKTNHNIDLIVVEDEPSAPAVKAKSLPLKTNHSLDPLPDAEAPSPAATPVKAKSIPLKTDAPKPRMVQPEEDLISLDCVEEKTPPKQMPPPLRPSGGMRKEIVSLEATDDGLTPRPSTEAQFIAPPPPQKPIASNVPRPPKKPAHTEFDNDNDLVLVNSSTPFVPKNLDTSVKEFSRSQAMKVEAVQPAKGEAPQPQASHAHAEAPQDKDDPSRRSTAPCIISLKNAKADTLLELPGYSPAVASALISAAQQGHIIDLASIAKIPGIDQKTFHQLTGLNPGDSLLAAERRLNVAAGLDPNQDFTLSTLLAGLTRKLGWHAALLISSGGLRASASGDTGKISADLDLAAAVIPQLIRRSSHSFGHAGLPPLNEISLHLGDHNLRFLPCGEAYLVLALPGTDPDPELMRRSREIATHLAWFCSSRLVP